MITRPNEVPAVRVGGWARGLVALRADPAAARARSSRSTCSSCWPPAPCCARPGARDGWGSVAWSRAWSDSWRCSATWPLGPGRRREQPRPATVARDPRCRTRSRTRSRV